MIGLTEYISPYSRANAVYLWVYPIGWLVKAWNLIDVTYWINGNSPSTRWVLPTRGRLGGPGGRERCRLLVPHVFRQIERTENANTMRYTWLDKWRIDMSRWVERPRKFKFVSFPGQSHCTGTVAELYQECFETFWDLGSNLELNFFFFCPPFNVHNG